MRHEKRDSGYDQVGPRLEVDSNATLAEVEELLANAKYEYVAIYGSDGKMAMSPIAGTRDNVDVPLEYFDLVRGTDAVLSHSQPDRDGIAHRCGYYLMFPCA